MFFYPFGPPLWQRDGRGDDLGRAFFRALAALDASVIVDAGQVVLHGDGPVLALAGAEHAAKTACRADLLHLGAFVPVGALHSHPVFRRQQGDQPLGAGLDAQATAHTAASVDHGYAVADSNGMLRAELDTGPQAHAAVVTVRERQTRPHRAGAVGNADIVALVFGDLAGALALDKGDLPLDFPGLSTHDGADLCGNGTSAHGAAVDRRLALGNGGRHRVAACKTAGAAVVARKGFPDGSLPLAKIYFNKKFK